VRHHLSPRVILSWASRLCTIFGKLNPPSSPFEVPPPFNTHALSSKHMRVAANNCDDLLQVRHREV
jgi:hypothetical protein